MVGIKEQLKELVKEKLSVKKVELSPQIKKIIHLVPNELRSYIESISANQNNSAILNQFQPGLLPLGFSFCTRGGWITGDAKLFIRTSVSRKEAQIKSRIPNPQKYGSIMEGAFKNSWVRQDWYQPIFSTKFTLNMQCYRKLVFTFDPKTAFKNARMYTNIQSIARAYTLIMPKGFWYEIVLVKYKENGLEYERKRFKGLGAFLLELRNIKNGSKSRFEKENFFNNPYKGI